MKMPMICLAVLAGLATPAAADTQYDRKLEKAVMEIVAGKIGALRGGFGYDAKPAFVVVHPPAVQEPATADPMITGSILAGRPFADPHDWTGGLMLANERKVSRVITF
jgi:hypothetical protein